MATTYSVGQGEQTITIYKSFLLQVRFDNVFFFVGFPISNSIKTTRTDQKMGSKRKNKRAQKPIPMRGEGGGTQTPKQKKEEQINPRRPYRLS
jgi:hypothetical protein